MNGHEDAARLNRLVDELGRRFREIATRRVAADDVDDVVQEALRVVVQKSSGTGSFQELPPIAWSMQVLRNTVGNYYKRERTRRRWMEAPDGEETPEGRASLLDQPLEAVESAQALGIVTTALDDMKRSDPQCGDYLARVVDGDPPGAIAAAVGVEASAFYKRLLRCREKLRTLLLERGLDV